MCRADDGCVRFFIGGVMVVMTVSSIILFILTFIFDLFGPLKPISLTFLIGTGVILFLLGIIGCTSFTYTSAIPHYFIGWILLLALQIGCYLWFLYVSGVIISTPESCPMQRWWNESSNLANIGIQETYYGCCGWSTDTITKYCTYVQSCKHYFTDKINFLAICYFSSATLWTIIIMIYWCSNCDGRSYAGGGGGYTYLLVRV